MDTSRKRMRRSLSPDGGDAAGKRRRFDVAPTSPAPPSTSSARRAATIQDITGSHEVFLAVLSFLDAADLVQLEQVSKAWRQMALDNHLWKGLYLSTYPKPRGWAIRESSDSVASALAPASSGMPSSASSTWRRAQVAASNPGEDDRGTGGDAHDEGSGIRAVTHTKTPEPADESTNWKALYRVGSNWLKGKAAVRSLSSPATPKAPRDRHSTSPTPQARPRPAERALPDGNLVALSSSFIFTAQPSSPLLHVHLVRATQDAESSEPSPLDHPVALIPPPPGWSSPARPEVITSIAVDQFQSTRTARSSPVRLAVFYRSGGWVILEVQLGSRATSDGVVQGRTSAVTWRRTTVYQPPESLRRRNRRRHFVPDPDDAITISAFFWPVLISCSNKFFLSIYRVGGNSPSDGIEPRLLQTLHSPVSFHPATLSLSPVTSVAEAAITEDTWSVREDMHAAEDIQYRAVLAYASPIYPQSWTVTAQEMLVTLPTTPSVEWLKSKAAGEVEAGRCYRVARKVRPGGAWHDRRWPWRFGAKGDILGVKGQAASAIGLDEHWCLLAGEDNQIQVYALPGESASDKATKPEGDRQAAALHHTQTLLAHSAAITSVALSSGRCVSAARDGKVLVWELDASSHQAEREEREEADVLARLNRIREGVSSEIKSVEVRSGSAFGITTRAAPSANLPADELLTGTSKSGTQALRRHLLPEPPVPHPLSLAGVVKEYRFATTSLLQDSATSAPKTIVRKITFNDEMIAGLVEPTVEDAQESMSSPAQAGEAEFVRIWKFDV